MSARAALGWAMAAAAGAFVATASVAAPQGARQEPTVVMHPLTPEERLQEADYLAYAPMMDGLNAFGHADPAKLEERARLLRAGPMRTDSPFVDWGRYAALAIAELDAKSPADVARAEAWGRDWAELSRAANARFEQNEEGRAATLADNLLCAYRESEPLKAECLVAAAARAKQADPALDLDWGGWILEAAAGLERPAAAAGGWDGYERAMVGSGKKAEQAAELRRKAAALTAWAMLLNPPKARVPYDAMEKTRSWAAQAHWSAGRPARAPWFALGARGEEKNGASGEAGGQSGVK